MLSPIYTHTGTIQRAVVALLIIQLVACPLLVRGQFQLPGILFKDKCGPETMVACQCHTYNPADPLKKLFKDWCSSWESIVNCMDEKNKTGTFVGLMFEKDSFVRKAEYVCGLYNDVEPDLDCLANEQDRRHCEDQFSNSLGQISKTDEGCMSALSLRKCYQNSLENRTECPSLVEHFFLEFTDIFIPQKCTVYDHPQTDQCALLDAFLFKDRDTLQECYESVKVVRQCLERERPYSDHIEDKLQHLDFNYGRYEDMKNEMCRVHQDMDKLCTAKYKEKYGTCSATFAIEFYKLVERQKQGDTVLASDLCPLYSKLMSCNSKVFSQCDKGPLYFNLTVCSSAPQTCPCPVTLNTKPSNAAATLVDERPSVLIICVLLTVYMYLLCPGSLLTTRRPD